jgi:hypothetical protein
MSVRAAARYLSAKLLFSLVASAMVLGAGCSFDSGASGLECSQEGDRRAGEVCRDGYWRITDDAGLDVPDHQDAADHQDVPQLQDGAIDGRSDADADEETDTCTSRSDETICRSTDSCSASLRAQDRCSGAERLIDCTPFFDFRTDPLNCGGCAQQCSAQGDHATPTCTDGECGFDCESGWVDVNGDASDGCESECSPTNGGVEICDGRDNNCDGQVDGADAAEAQTYFRDADNDGYGDSSDTVRACGAPVGYVADDTDCDDTDAATNPGADEVCDGTIDDNCDGSVDEQCPCTNGQTQPCGTDVGTCQQGTQTCINGQWALECRGSMSAEAEACDDLDNDCDSQIDEDFADKGSACTVGQGECSATGSYVCTQDGTGTECSATAGTPAASETCSDGLDNDCNGLVDDGCRCDYNGDSDGVCADGVVDTNGVCQPPATYESQESSCDELDNDCDGQVDELLRELKYPDADLDGYGSASGGSRVCPGVAGWVDSGDDCDDTDPLTYPGAPEICDGKDNNCNYIERDDGGSEAGSWCSRYVSGDNIYCGGPGSGVANLCCEISNDGDLGCDFETVCDNGIDEDTDGDTDCADVDCDGLSCGSAKTCQSGSCQPI